MEETYRGSGRQQGAEQREAQRAVCRGRNRKPRRRRAEGPGAAGAKKGGVGVESIWIHKYAEGGAGHGAE